MRLKTNKKDVVQLIILVAVLYISWAVTQRGVGALEQCGKRAIEAQITEQQHQLRGYND